MNVAYFEEVMSGQHQVLTNIFLNFNFEQYNWGYRNEKKSFIFII
ncbi:hypothetical protein BN1058_01965 [Paraliobacillus sp. PM-2]|nr:hypothetical protein BN1058_01965 [Paraliobacillus sp. PM-2]